MKKFILCVALLMATIAATAQHNYDSGHKYGLTDNDAPLDQKVLVRKAIQ